MSTTYKYQSAFDTASAANRSERVVELHVDGTRYGVPSFNLGIRTQDRRIGCWMKDADAIHLAEQILSRIAPERLAPKPEPTFSETPVGTYLRNVTSGKVIKVVESDDRWKRYKLDVNCLTAVTADGSIITPYQGAAGEDYTWEVVEAVEKTVFEVVE